ncbi:MAG: hypothetical protein C4575_13635 [Desulforudis sp.]|nr:MAG: hypothetical protein C4575_13635 [Desulforudis sp.]
MSAGSRKNVQNHGGRPSIEINRTAFLGFYHNGLTDQQIAEHLGVSRQTAIRFRQANGLKPNRKRGERGAGAVREHKAYYEEIKRVMRIPEVARAVYRAAKMFRDSGGDEATSYVATVIDPAPLPRVNPGSWCSPADKINLTQIKYIVTVEQQAERAVVAGVPGPAVFELTRAVKSGSPRLIEKLAMSAVVNAFMVGVHETVAKVMAELNPVYLSRRALSAVKSTWERIWTACLEWAPVQSERRARAAAVRAGGYGGGTGKAGKGGGRVNLHDRTAWAGANGY